MAEAMQIPDKTETRLRWGDFAWTEADAVAQPWLPVPVIQFVARPIGATDMVFGECDR